MWGTELGALRERWARVRKSVYLTALQSSLSRLDSTPANTGFPSLLGFYSCSVLLLLLSCFPRHASNVLRTHDIHGSTPLLLGHAVAGSRLSHSSLCLLFRFFSPPPPSPLILFFSTSFSDYRRSRDNKTRRTMPLLPPSSFLLFESTSYVEPACCLLLMKISFLFFIPND